MQAETWKTIGQCPAYDVSSLGRVRRARPGIRTRVGLILRPNKTGGKGRYLGVTLVMNGERQYATVRRLVCEAFHGLPPSPSHETAHLNGDSRDNRAENLGWVLRVENARHRDMHGTSLRGERGSGAKLTAADVGAIRAEYAAGSATHLSLAIKFGVDKATAGRIVRGDTWKNPGAAP